MRQRVLSAAVAVSLVFLTACFDVEQALKLQKDLSGEVGFTMTIDMEPMFMFMYRMQREMKDQKGEPTAAEIAQARKEFLASGKKSGSTPSKADVENNLPKGIKLLSHSVTEDGLKMTAKINLAFDHVSKLSEVDLKTGKKAAAGPGPGNPFEKPFPLTIKDEGGTLLLTMEAVNPAAEQKEQTGQMKMSPEETKIIEDAFKSLRVAFRIDSALPVVEHNATRKEGQTLYWEYDVKTLNKMTPQQLSEGVKLRLRK